jgi:hypothetical protein
MAYMVEELPNKHQSLSPNLTNAKKKKKKKKISAFRQPASKFLLYLRFTYFNDEYLVYFYGINNIPLYGHSTFCPHHLMDILVVKTTTFDYYE